MFYFAHGSRKQTGALCGAVAALLMSAVAGLGQVQPMQPYTPGQGYPPGYAPIPAPPVPQLPAQPPIVVAPGQPAPAAGLLSPSQLDDLTAGVALYPDPLLASMLPAASYPQEIASAYAWARLNPGASDATISTLAFQPAVKNMMQYPSTLAMMSDNIEWTQALGAAFTYQQGDVMASIQRLRLEAQLAGTLQSTPQQNVILENNVVRIVPAEAGVVYVPVYDPRVVYVRHPGEAAALISFQAGGHIGGWLDVEFDWHGGVLRVPTDGHWDLNHRPAQGEGRAWVRDAAQPRLDFPARIVTPMADHKEIVPPQQVNPQDSREPARGDVRPDPGRGDPGRGRDERDRGR